MFVIKGKINNIIAVSDTLDYQENGNPLVHDGTLAIAEILVGSIEESDVIPEGWEYVDGVYRVIKKEKTPEEFRQEGFDECVALLMEEGVI